MEDVMNMILFGKGERVVEDYFIASKPYSPKIEEHLLVTNKRLLLIANYESFSISGKVIDEMQIEKIKGAQIALLKKVNEPMFIAGALLIVMSVFSLVLGILLFHDFEDELCIIGLLPVLLIIMILGTLLIKYSPMKIVFIKLKAEHIGQIEFGVLGKRGSVFARRPGPDAERAVRELGQLIRTIQDDPNYMPPPKFRDGIPKNTDEEYPPPNYRY